MACITEDLNPPIPILGCTDPGASNYNADANTDDGSCVILEAGISGCTDPTAINYNPNATVQTDNCECIYDECPTGMTISQDGVIFVLGPLVTIGNGGTTAPSTPASTQGRDLGEVIPIFETRLPSTGALPNLGPANLPQNGLTEDCCDITTNPALAELTGGQEVEFIEGVGCKLVNPIGCPDNLTVIEGVLFGGNGDEVNQIGEDCCNNVEGFTYSTNFLNPNGTLGACLEDTNFTEEDCTLTLNQVIYQGDTVVFDASQPITVDPNVDVESALPTFNTRRGETSGGQTNLGSSEDCFPINSWYFRVVDTNSELTNPVNSNQTFLEGTKLLTFNTSDLPNIQVGGQINSGNVTIETNSCFSNSYNGQTIDNFLNNVSYIVDIQPNTNQDGFVITTNVPIGNFLDTTNSLDCNPQIQESAQACSVVVGASNLGTGGFGLRRGGDTISIGNASEEIEGILDPCDDDGTGGEPPSPAPNNNIQNLSEACCSILGSDLGWEYLNGVCYWNPPTPTPTVQIGLSETDIQVLDPECTNLTVTASFYIERPNSVSCEPNDGQDISASLAIYSGNSVNNTSTMVATPSETYSLSNDGYCQWTTITSNINLNDNTPFKVKVILDGLKECCNYDIFVDDIAVNCQKQDSLVSENYTKCPGFKLTKVVDNKKSWVRNTETPINRTFAPSPDADIPWRYTNYFEQSGVYENDSRLVLNSKELYLNFNMKKVKPKCPEGYTLLNDQCIRQTSLCPSGFTLSGQTCVSGTTTTPVTIENNFYPINLSGCQEELSIYELINYKKNFQNFWVKFIEQFVPATTIFVSGEKWSNREDEICEVIEPCGYINNFSELDLGLRSTNGVPTRQTRNKNINKRSNVVTSVEKVTSNKNGDYSNNKTDAPILFDNFKASFLKKDDSILSSRRLTLRQGELELLKKGQKSYQDKFKEKVYIIETNES